MNSSDLLQSTLKFNNVIPIVVSAIMMTASAVVTYSAISVRLALVEQKLDSLISQNERLIIKYSEVESRYGTLSLKVNSLETLQRADR